MTVSRVLYLTVIYLRAALPRYSSHPGSGRANLYAPIPVLLRIEFTASDTLEPTGALLPHLSTFSRSTLPFLACTSALRYIGREAADPERQSAQVVYFCCTFPQIALGGRYPLSLPCGARTFLTASLSASPRDCLSYSQTYFNVSLGACQRKIRCYFALPVLY